MKYFGLLLITISMVSCTTANKEKNNIKETTQTIETTDTTTVVSPAQLSPVQEYVTAISKAHYKEAFLSHKVISFSIDVDFGGKPYIDGKITMRTDGTKIRIDKKDGSTVLYNGEKVFLCPEDASDQGARFDIFTWSYFFAMPYKLEDPGTQWELQENRPLDGIAHQTAKLTFGRNIGDAPDDWYVTYSDSTHVLKAAAYIVSFGSNGNLSKAESDPHAIQFKAFTTVENIPFATQWEFYGWTAKEGMKSQLGEAKITDITFLPSEGAIFETPEKAKEISL